MLAGILDELDQRNVYEYLKGMVNCQRIHLFDVVNQYRAIFADDTSGSEENYDGGLLFSWAMHQISSHLNTLKIMLPKITEGGSLSNILDQCMVRFFPCAFNCIGEFMSFEFSNFCLVVETWGSSIVFTFFRTLVSLFYYGSLLFYKFMDAQHYNSFLPIFESSYIVTYMIVNCLDIVLSDLVELIRGQISGTFTLPVYMNFH